MGKISLHFLIPFLLMGNASFSYAQDDKKADDSFWVSAQIRTRGEYRNGALYPRDKGESPAGFVNERARLTFGYDRQKLALRFSAQHVGVWGQDALIDKNGRFILNEAWASTIGLCSWVGRRWCTMMNEFSEALTGMLPDVIMTR